MWRNRDYLLLWSGQSISWLGSGISQLALPLLVLALTKSATQAGLVGALEVLPQIVIGLIAGALVDRWNRKWVMIICDIGRSLILASIAIALVLKSLPMQLLYFLVPAEGAFAVFFNLAASSRLPYIVAKEQLPAAVAQDQTSQAVTSLVSPSLGGLFYSLAPFLPFLADAVSYLASIISLCFLKTAFQQEHAAKPPELHLAIREGFLWLWEQRVVRSLSFLIGGVGFTAGGHTLLLIVLAQHQHASSTLIGLMFTVAGIGSIIGSQLAPFIQKRFPFGWITITGCGLFVLLWPLYAVVSSPLALGAVFAGLAFSSVILEIGLLSYLLVLIPDELRGRVNSITSLILLVSRSLGIALTGFLLQQFGTFPTTMFFWVCLVLVALVAIFNPHLRNAR